ncbi:extracellular solute-binding protein [uncultured Thermanaerothrix sp.]|uniref:extracellular solute-binding protein n=1 Tax=uncultured Thermanaerothrix sp. TaxID=1195149 RepID=UPI00262E91CD|nr:extracellular solute-binding protein [uncultured Thermanaerothrix sp.]
MLVGLVWLLVACQVRPQPETSPTLTPHSGPTPRSTQALMAATETPALPAVALQGVRVNFWHPWVGALEIALSDLALRFNHENPWGIEVKVDSAGSSMVLADWVESGHPEGEIAHGVVAPPATLLTWYVRDKRMRPLNDWLNDGEWGLSEARRAEIPLVFWQSDQVDGWQIGLPAQRSATVLFYNLTWAAELGFHAPPQTPEEWRDQACAAAAANRRDADRTNDGTGGWLVNTDPLTALAWLRAFGLRNEFDATNRAWRFNQPEALEAWGFLRDLIEDGCAWVGRDPSPYAYFAQRRALFYSGDVLDLPSQQQAMARRDSADVWTVRPYPGRDKPLVIVSGLSYGVLRSTPAQELATWLFIRWLDEPEQHATLVRAGGGYPMGPSAVAWLEDYRAENPQWGGTLALIPIAQIPPNTPAWRQAQWVVQDAFAQVLQGTTPRGALPDVLAELDATLAEVAQGF